MAVGIDVTGWSEEGILEAVRNEIGKNLTAEERSKLSFRLDHHDKDFVAVVVNFDGPGGLIIVDNVWLATGEDQTELYGQYLYITSNAQVFTVEQPEVYYIRQA